MFYADENEPANIYRLKFCRLHKPDSWRSLSKNARNRWRKLYKINQTDNIDEKRY